MEAAAGGMDTWNGGVQQHEPLSRRLMTFSDNEVYGKVFLAYFMLVKRTKFWIVAIWIALMVWGGATGFRYIREARDEMTAPDGTRAAVDESAFAREFKDLSTATQLIVLVSCKHKGSPGCMVACARNDTGSACSGFNKEIEAFSHGVAREILARSDALGAGYLHNPMGFYLLAGTDLDRIKSQFASPDGTATFVVFTGSGAVESSVRYKLVEEITDKIIPGLRLDSTKYSAGITGVDPMTRDGSTAAVEESERIDMITMPIAFALLAYMVRSWRLLLISLANMGMTILTSLGVLTVLTDATGKPPMTTTASFVEVLGLACCVDYSLFLLRRFRDESKNGRQPELAIKIMLSQAGHVVMMSSLTIIFVFAGFLFMKSTDLMVQGLACVVTVTCSLLVNMTNTPALLLMYPHFFGQFDHAPQRDQVGPCTQVFESLKGGAFWIASHAPFCGRRRHDSGVDDGDLLSGDYAELAADEDGGQVPLQYLTSPTAEVLRQRGGPYKGWYYRLLVFVTQWPYNLGCLVLLYVMVIPLAIQALHLERNANLLLAIPRGSESGTVFVDLNKDFAGGSLSPMYVMVEGPRAANGLLDPTHGRQVRKGMVELTARLAQATGIPAQSFTSVASFPFSLWAPLLNSSGVMCHYLSSECALFQFLWHQTVNPANTSALINVVVPFDPFGPKTEVFVKQVFDELAHFRAGLGPTASIRNVHFAGVQVGMIEDMVTSFDQMPMLVGVTCIVVFTLIAVMLKSAFVLIRLTLTVVLPLAAMFGLSVLVYQKGVLDWTGIDQLSSSPDGQGFFWYVPLLCFTLTVGLALDYDVLVISRIREHRFSGLHIRAAILRSMWEVNSTLIAAGLIMFLAFGSLILSATAAVNQMSFILASSVLFDTFVIQTVVVPCIMSFADHLAWWPGRPPMDDLVTLEEEVESRNKAFGELDAAQADGLRL